MNTGEFREQFFKDVTAIISNHFVDDYLDSVPNKDEFVGAGMYVDYNRKE